MSACGLPETETEIRAALEVATAARNKAEAELKRAEKELAALRELCSHPTLTEPGAYGWRGCALCGRPSVTRDERQTER